MKSILQAGISMLVFLGVVSCGSQVGEPPNTSDELARKYRQSVVVSARQEASDTGAEVMRNGGTAFDAMVATDFALAVCFPFAGNIGGGGFMVYRTAIGEVGSLDYRETAPDAAHERMFQDSLGNVVMGLSTEGALAAGIPGTVAGLWETHRKFGSMPWADLVQPAIDLAERGFVVTERQAAMLARAQDAFAAINPEIILFLNDWKAGDTIKQPALARTLRKIRDNGRDGFYRGEIARRSVDFIQENGGIWSLDDLAGYEPVWRDALQFDFQEYDVTTMGLPSSGGILLAQMLIALEDRNLENLEHNSPEYIQLVARAMQLAYTDRTLLGDPGFTEVDVARLLNKDYIQERMLNADLARDVWHEELIPDEKDETTHYSIVDSYGNAIAVTTTINGAYGSKLYSNELGYFFNNEMDDFSSKPGASNMFGLLGSYANRIEPGKRMLSSMTPTIVSKERDLYMVLGSPGGSTIITTVLQNILNTTQYDMSMQESVSAARFHHQWRPDELILEPGRFSPSVFEALKRDFGYAVTERQSRILGKVDAVKVTDGELETGADPRGDDASAVVEH
ncbi:MAG: gamma-glutamyltransferase [Weeksellaceae bacterium]|nr:gamma-glutamyltransferase [Weeksellaceae bacterium]